MYRGENKHHNQLSIREYILRRVSKKVKEELLNDLSEDKVREIVESIHYHQFKEALNHTKTDVLIEFTGLGSYRMNRRRAINRLKKEEQKREELYTKLQKEGKYEDPRLEQYDNDIKELKEKIRQHYEFYGDMGGVEKSPDPAKETEEVN